MRIDKFLKVSRVIKRRQVAKDACAGGRVEINGKVAKPGSEVEAGDVVAIRFASGVFRFEVLRVAEHVRKEEAETMVRILEGHDEE